MQSGALGRIISAVTRRATFQAPPSVAEERGWPAEGTTVPAAIAPGHSPFCQCRVEPSPELISPVTGRGTFQAPPSVAEERGRPPEGTTVPAASCTGKGLCDSLR